MLTIRYNFETNSSSMHSLAFRTGPERYSEEELRRIDGIKVGIDEDAVIILKDNIDKSYADAYYQRKEDDDEITLFSSDLDFAYSAMSIQYTFHEKLCYLLGSVMHFAEYSKYFDEIENAVSEYYGRPMTISKRWLRDGFCRVNTDTVVKFIVENNISFCEFLSNPRYLIVVNIAEFFQMQWLEMVDMSQVETIICGVMLQEPESLNIVDGVWTLNDDDIYFGRSPYRVLGSVEGKARYALATFSRWPEKRKETIAAIKEIFPEIKKVKFPKERWGNKLDYGSADDSCLPLDIPIKEFLLNRRYVVISDGDEYGVWKDFCRSPMINRTVYQKDGLNDDE